MKHSHSGDSCAVKMNRLSAAGCQDIVSFGNQLNLNCVFIGYNTIKIVKSIVFDILYKVINLVDCTGQKLISQMAQLDGKATVLFIWMYTVYIE